MVRHGASEVPADSRGEFEGSRGRPVGRGPCGGFTGDSRRTMDDHGMSLGMENHNFPMKTIGKP